MAGQAGPKGAQLREVIVEFGRHLDMLAEQLNGALTEADRECHSVGESFHDMATAKNIIAGIGCGNRNEVSCEVPASKLAIRFMPRLWHYNITIA